jgi:hypothetical protein
MHLAVAGFTPNSLALTGMDRVAVLLEAGKSYLVLDRHPDINRRRTRKLFSMLYVVAVATARTKVSTVLRCCKEVATFQIGAEVSLPHGELMRIRSASIIVGLVLEKQQC